MIIKTNIVLDEVNQNGRMYSTSVYEKALKEFLKGPSIIYTNSLSAEKTDIMKTVGTIDSYDIIHNKIVLNGKFLSSEIPQQSKSMYESGLLSVSAAGYGKVDEDGLVSDFKLNGFFMTANPA